jgi:hypothetical protein
VRPDQHARNIWPGLTTTTLGAIVMASTILLPKRAAERVDGIATRSSSSPSNALRGRLRLRSGHKATSWRSTSSRELRLLAEQYFDQNRNELIGDAAHVIATSPHFARWRLPESVRKHSLSRKGNGREIQHERRCADYCRPNAAPCYAGGRVFTWCRTIVDIGAHHA